MNEPIRMTKDEAIETARVKEISDGEALPCKDGEGNALLHRAIRAGNGLCVVEDRKVRIITRVQKL